MSSDDNLSSPSYDDEYIVATNKISTVFCSLCKVYLSENDYNIWKHNLGQNHLLLKAEDYMKDHAISHVKDDNDQLWCKVCKIYFTYETYSDLYNHIENADHISWFEEINELIDGEDINIDDYCESFAQDKAYCGLCKVWVPCVYENLNTHIHGNNHSHLNTEYYKKRNAIFNVENDSDQLWCKVCKIYFEYKTYEDLQHHTNDLDHCSWLQEIEQLIDGQGINIEDYRAYVTEHKAYCSRCNVWVSCSYDCLEQHINGWKHNQ